MRVRIGAAACLALLTGGCGTGTTDVEVPGPAPLAATVTLSASRFEPDTTELAVGGTVTFVNVAGVLHDVDFGTPQWHVAPFESGERSLTFQAAGRFGYHCNLHIGMEATLIVR